MKHLVTLLIFLGAAATAHAQDEGGVVIVNTVATYTKDTWPSALVERPLTLAAGMFELQANLSINLSDSEVLKPVTLAPNLYYGVSDRFTIGIAHTTHFLDGNLGGLCLVGDTDCDNIRYRFVAGDALVSLWRALGYEVIARGGIDVTAEQDLSGTTPSTSYKFAARLGATLRYHYSALGVDVGAYGILGEPKYFYLPVYVYYQATPAVALGVMGAGRAGDGGAVSAGLLVFVNVTRTIDLGASFEFPTVKHTDFRTATLTVNVRL